MIEVPFAFRSAIVCSLTGIAVMIGEDNLMPELGSDAFTLTSPSPWKMVTETVGPAGRRERVDPVPYRSAFEVHI